MAELDPVSIEIQMRQNVEDEAKKASSASKKLTKDVRELENATKRSRSAGDAVPEGNVRSLNAQNSATKALTAAIRKLESTIRKTQLAGGAVSKKDLAKLVEMELKVKSLTANVQKLEAASKRSQSSGGIVPANTSVKLKEVENSVKSVAAMANRSVSGVSLNVQQVVRELPAAMMGPQMFFMAISNNLPMLSDSIRKAKVEYTELTKAGLKATPVWKQVLSSMFSWQTGMVVGITLLIAYGKEIGNSISELFNWKNKLDELNESISAGFKEAALEAAKAAKSETVELDLLYKASQNEALSKEERLRAIKKLKDEYPSYFSQISNEEFLTGKAASAYANLSKNIIEAAKARVYADKISENQGKIFELEEKQVEAERKAIKANSDLAASGFASKSADSYSSPAVREGMFIAESRIRSRIKEAQKEVDDAQREIDALNKSSQDLANRISVDGLTFDSGRSNEGGVDKGGVYNRETSEDKMKKAFDDIAKWQSEYAAKAEQSVASSRISAMNDGYNMQLAELRKNYIKIQAEIAKEELKLQQKEAITGQTATAARSSLGQWGSAAASQYQAEIGALSEKHAAEIDAVMQEVNGRFATQLAANMQQINSYYDELTEKAQQSGATEEQLITLQAAREREINSERMSDRLRLFDFESELAARRFQSSEKAYMFEADRERDLLDLQRRTITNRLQLLNEKRITDPAEETTKAISELNAELDETNAKLTRIPVRKLQEISGFFSGIAGNLDKAFGTDDAFSKLSELSSIAADIASGNFLGAASGGISFIADLFGQGAEEAERLREIQVEINRLQIDYENQLRQQNYDLITSVDYIRIFKNELETLNWLVQNGFISEKNYSSWEALNYQLAEAKSNLNDVMISYENAEKRSLAFFDNFSRVLSTFHKSIIDSYFSGEIDLLTALEKINATGEFTGLDQIIEGLKNGQEETDKWIGEIESLKNQMDEFSTGTSFDNFLQSGMDAISQLKGGVSGLSDFTKEALSDAIVSSFKYQILSNAMQKYYNELADKFTDGIGNVDESWASDWRDRLSEELNVNGEILNSLFDELGVSQDSFDRSGASKGIESITQDSANELNGNFYAIRQQVGDIRNITKEANLQRQAMQSLLSRIADNTEYCRYLETINGNISDMQNQGVKMRV